MTLRQRRFCHEYLVRESAAAAAVCAGYSERTARSIAAENLTKPDIRAEIDRLIAADEERLAEKRQRVRARLERLAFDDATPVRYALPALALLAKHLGMLVERVHVDAAVTEVRQPEWSIW